MIKSYLFTFHLIIMIQYFELFFDSLKQCQTVALHTLIRLINQNDTYKDVFREVGLLEVLINAIKEFSDQMKETCGGSK